MLPARCKKRDGRGVTEQSRYQGLLSYVGTDFHGWQLQRNAPRTVQAVVEKALSRFASVPVRARAAGRTDAGVHADGQVIDFELPGCPVPDRVRDGTNSMLPWDVKLLSVEVALSDFDARRDAVWKEYVYRWSRAAVIAPRDALFVAQISSAAKAWRMAEASDLLTGKKDFRVFAVRGSRGGSSTLRTLHLVRVEEEGEEIRAHFRGDAFLRGMVRLICGVLAHVARGKVPPGRISDLLETGDRRLLAPKAEARGLTLVRVHYEGR